MVSVRQSTVIAHGTKDQSIMGEAESFIEYKDISDPKLLNEVMLISIICTSFHKKNSSYCAHTTYHKIILIRSQETSYSGKQ